ncbi:MAG: acyl carrier protein [Candidatus Omnitrophica bacterium]|nr:acyl carrier protein [Candidatus Omnitrophota bacterium]
MSGKNNKRKNIEQIVKEIIADKLTKNISEINVDSILKDDLGMDSFSALELVFELKDKFGIEIPQEDFTKIKKVKDIVEYISSQISK